MEYEKIPRLWFFVVRAKADDRTDNDTYNWKRNYLGVRFVVTRVPIIPAARATSKIIPTQIPGVDTFDELAPSGSVALGRAVSVGGMLELVGVATIKAVGDARGVLVGGGGCVALI